MVRLLFCFALLTVHIVVLPAALAEDDSQAQSIQRLLDQADGRVWLGIGDKGASRAFAEGLDLLEQAEQRMDGALVSPAEKVHLQRQAEALREQLELLAELYEERFYGVFPLARLVLPTLLTEAGLANPEHLFHPPEIAAIEVAGRAFSGKVSTVDRPHLVLRSEPANRELEIVAHEVFAREGDTIPVSRRGLVQFLDASQLAALDAGRINQQTIVQMMKFFNAESLIVARLAPTAGGGYGLVKYVLNGDVYVRGEAVRGSPYQASPAVRVATITSFGSIIDRRQQLWPIILVQCALLLVSMLWAAGISWSPEYRGSTFHKAMIGLGLFLFGRLLTIVSVLMLNRVAPDPGAMLSSAWWWPCLLGLLVVVGVGMVAWVGQAQLTTIIPGVRGARPVGTIFALTSIGSVSYFVAPVLLLEASAGYATLIPFALCALMLAILFGYAVRTGPPVPHYFALGPLLLAPLAGVTLLKVSPKDLWVVTSASGALCLAAFIRHSYAVAKGFEEQEPSPEDAVAADTEKLKKLGKKLARKG